MHLDQVRSDIVVRIPERRVDGDRPLALFNRIVVATHEAERPRPEGVAFTGRGEPDRSFVGVGGPIEVPPLWRMYAAWNARRAASLHGSSAASNAFRSSGPPEKVSTTMSRKCWS